MTEERIKQEIKCIVCLKDVSRGSINTNFPPVIKQSLPFCSQECMEKVENALLCREEFEKDLLKTDNQKADLFEGGQKFERQKITGIIRQKIEEAESSQETYVLKRDKIREEKIIIRLIRLEVLQRLLEEISLSTEKEEGNKTSKNIATANLKDKNPESSLSEIDKEEIGE